MNRKFKKPAIFALILLTISLLEYSSPVFGQEVSDQTQGVTDPVTTFLISLGIGILGASSYLFILLMTDRNLSILENQILGTGVMATLFTLVGGIVAAVIQTSTGSGISVTSIQNVFMLGFGWQGVMSGAGGSSKVGELKEFNTDFNELLNDLAPADTS
jgi:hypothetical protein